MAVDWFNRSIEDSPAPEIVEISLKDGRVVKFAIVPMEPILGIESSTIAGRLLRRYVGNPETGTSPEEPFPPIGGKIVKVSEGIITICADVATQVVAHEGCETLEPEEAVAFLLTEPFAFETLYSKIQKLNRNTSKN